MMISHGSFCLRQLWEKPYRALTYTSFWVKCGWKVMTWIHFLTVEKNSHSRKGKNFSHAFFIIFLEFYLVDFWSSRCWRHRRPESEISDCFSFKHRQENQSEWVGCSAEPIQAASFHMTLEKKTPVYYPSPPRSPPTPSGFITPQHVCCLRAPRWHKAPIIEEQVVLIVLSAVKFDLARVSVCVCVHGVCALDSFNLSDLHHTPFAVWKENKPQGTQIKCAHVKVQLFSQTFPKMYLPQQTMGNNITIIL